MTYLDYPRRIEQSGLTIYDPIVREDPDLWIPTPALERLLSEHLVGVVLTGLPNRTRAKFVKRLVCEALGYPAPQSFARTRPRFPGQDFDVYVQKSSNLQIWNEEVTPTRRYALIGLSNDSVIHRVRVVTGETIAAWDKTGTLTRKHQARFVLGPEPAELVSKRDTDNIAELLAYKDIDLTRQDPCSLPIPGAVLPIEIVFDRLRTLLGSVFDDTGHDQERNRGEVLHRLVCNALGFEHYHDAGQMPDILNQLLEVKLQTATTIDLGLTRPDSDELFDMPRVGDVAVKHSDVRYALFYGKVEAGIVTLSHFHLITGKDFFHRFPQFQGNVINRKLQILLPVRFFET